MAKASNNTMTTTEEHYVGFRSVQEYDKWFEIMCNYWEEYCFTPDIANHAYTHTSFKVIDCKVESDIEGILFVVKVKYSLKHTTRSYV